MGFARPNQVEDKHHLRTLFICEKAFTHLFVQLIIVYPFIITFPALIDAQEAS
jgi:hypothetical protein